MTVRPTSFNLDSLTAEARGEDTAEPFRFRFGGEDYECPPRLDVRAMAAMTEGRIGDALRMLVGEDQWARIEKSPAPFDDRHLKALLNAYMTHQGGQPGESSASTGS